MNDKQMFDYFVNAGMTKAGACGLMGNLYAECGLISENLQNTGEKKLGMTDKEYTEAVDNGTYTSEQFIRDGFGYGLAQWTYWSRKEAFLKFMKANAKTVSDKKVQCDFLLKEINGYKKVWAVLTTTASVREASDVVLLEYERPADQSEKVQIKRASYGQNYFDKFAKKEEVKPSAPVVNNEEKTNSGLVEYAKAQVGTPYWYGTYGQISTKSVYDYKKKQYPKYYTATDFLEQLGKKVHDCCGLIKGYLWSADPNSPAKYNKKQDKSANGFYSASHLKGPISSFPKHKGQLVYKGKTQNSITHVGVYDGEGYVYEAKGHAYGTVKSKFDSSWTFWSQCPYCKDDCIDPPKKSVEDLAKEVIRGLWGNGAERKERLTKAGYDYRKIQNKVNEILK